MCKFKKKFFFFALWGMITEAMVKLCIVQGSFRSVESSWHWDCCTLKAISLSSCPCGSTWKFSQKFFLKDTQTHIILFSPVVIIWVLLLRLYCIFFHLIFLEKAFDWYRWRIPQNIKQKKAGTSFCCSF